MAKPVKPAPGPGRFELFIDDFANRNLDVRSRSVVRLLAVVLVFSTLALGVALTRDFDVTATVATHAERGGMLTLSFGKNLAKFVSGTPSVTCRAEGSLVDIAYEVSDVTSSFDGVTISAKSHSPEQPTTILNCRVVLTRKSYWSLLMEKGGESDAPRE